MTIYEIAFLCSSVLGVVLNAFGICAMRAKRKRLEAERTKLTAALENLPCPFCDAREFEHLKQCPVAKKRGVDKIGNRILIWEDNGFTKESKTIFKEVCEKIGVPPNPQPVSTSYKFKPGQWVRSKHPRSYDELMRIECFTQGSWLTNLGGRIFEMDIEPAFPHAGEWWRLKRCEHHWGYGDPFKVTLSEEELKELKSTHRCWIDCGCMEPANFGKGNA